MASRSINTLTPEFRTKVVELMALTVSRYEATYKPFYTMRTPWEQAKLWRQSRSSATIRSARERILSKGGTNIISIVDSVGPQNGRWATNALPGFSEHQYGLACDFFRVGETGGAIWNSDAYKELGDACLDLDLESGHFWNHSDSVHVQMRAPRRFKVTDVNSWCGNQIDQHGLTGPRESII